jgi:hypothetical protein
MRYEFQGWRGEETYVIEDIEDPPGTGRIITICTVNGYPRDWNSSRSKEILKLAQRVKELETILHEISAIPSRSY